MKEWMKFKVGEPSKTRNGFNPDCVPFSTISHVSHIKQSVSILQENRIKSSLVFDESKLNKKRIQVVWLSPNDWAYGSRYGNVRFSFDPTKIFENKNLFWVESMAYKVAACRILVTEKKYDGLPKYDPSAKDGPWWYDSKRNEHYFNSKYCLEIMLENDLEIDDTVKIDFVNHHDSWCAMNRSSPNSCQDLGLDQFSASGKLLAEILASEIEISITQFEPLSPQKTFQGF